MGHQKVCFHRSYNTLPQILHFEWAAERRHEKYMLCAYFDGVPIAIATSKNSVVQKSVRFKLRRETVCVHNMFLACWNYDGELTDN